MLTHHWLMHNLHIFPMAELTAFFSAFDLIERGYTGFFCNVLAFKISGQEQFACIIGVVVVNTLYHAKTTQNNNQCHRVNGRRTELLI